MMFEMEKVCVTQLNMTRAGEVSGFKLFMKERERRGLANVNTVIFLYIFIYHSGSMMLSFMFSGT